MLVCAAGRHGFRAVSPSPAGLGCAATWAFESGPLRPERTQGSRHADVAFRSRLSAVRASQNIKNIKPSLSALRDQVDEFVAGVQEELGVRSLNAALSSFSLLSSFRETAIAEELARATICARSCVGCCG